VLTALKMLTVTAGDGARAFELFASYDLAFDIAIPDYTLPSRRGGGLTILPKAVGREEQLHLLVDSTGLKIYDECLSRCRLDGE
jgi:hypothetical protein